jgi:copper chaperone CopZ
MRKQLSLILSLNLILFATICLSPASRAVESADKGLHRLDFRLEKASCATCILKVRKALRESPGVVACEISIKKPYGGVLFFNPAKMNIDKVRTAAMAADPHHKVQVVEPLEKAVPRVPSLIVPLYTNLNKGQAN